MCRMLVSASTLARLDDVLRYLDALVASAERDPLLAKLGLGRESHGDGWGYAAYIHSTWSGPATAFYRSASPIYREVQSVEALKHQLSGADVAACVVHARLASKGQPLGLGNTHPFHATGRGFELWLAHNGSVDKKILAEKLGLEHMLSSRTDTFFLTEFIARQLTCVDPEELMHLLSRVIEEGFVKTALNVGLLAVEEERALLLILSYYVAVAPPRSEYYEMYALLENNLILAGSSTLFKCYGRRYSEKLCNGCGIAVEVAPEGFRVVRFKVSA
ncbi:MAG: hypothetical protein DRO12_01985 [Thermoprotei archaeon]|nr:MAG: hypothetical protein DRO12_01985 [Thermoprotei archaeon]